MIKLTFAVLLRLMKIQITIFLRKFFSSLKLLSCSTSLSLHYKFLLHFCRILFLFPLAKKNQFHLNALADRKIILKC